MNWYALYTRPFWEKRIEKTLHNAAVEVWCPMRKVYRQWSDRKKMIEEPVFRSYVFVRIDDKDRGKVLGVEGVVDFIRTQGQPARIREVEIDAVKEFLKEFERVDVEALKPGARVRINNELFNDKEAIVQKVEGHQVVLELAQLEWKLTARLEDIKVL